MPKTVTLRLSDEDYQRFQNFAKAVQAINAFWELVELPEWSDGYK